MDDRYDDSNRVEVPHRRIVVNTHQFSIDCEIKSRILVCDLGLLMTHVKYDKEAILNKPRLATVMRLFNYMLYGHANDRATKNSHGASCNFWSCLPLAVYSAERIE